MAKDLEKEGMECQECHAWIYPEQKSHTFLDCAMVIERKRLRSDVQRFWSKVQPMHIYKNCWVWQGSKNNKGYGHFHSNGKNRLAHRYAYELLVGEIPDGLQIDHTCRIRECVNPDHMEVVTSKENTLRGEGPTAKNAKKTHCNNGHEFTEANTYQQKNGRECRICRTARKARFEERKRCAESARKDDIHIPQLTRLKAKEVNNIREAIATTIEKD